MKDLKPQFIVKDWAGNVLDFYGTSPTFEDAWSKIFEHYPYALDEHFDEFYVEEV